jgi:hypothetical protein
MWNVAYDEIAAIEAALGVGFSRGFYQGIDWGGSQLVVQSSDHFFGADSGWSADVDTSGVVNSTHSLVALPVGVYLIGGYIYATHAANAVFRLWFQNATGSSSIQLGLFNGAEPTALLGSPPQRPTRIHRPEHRT